MVTKFLIVMNKGGPARTRSFLLPFDEPRQTLDIKPGHRPMTDNAASTYEPRLVSETGVDARIAEIVEPVLASIDMRLVRVRLSGQNGLTLQIMAERADGTMTVEDCEAASRALSPVLDVEDPVEKAYHLEISSPGIDRPLVRKSDFERWQGHLARCDSSVLINGRKRFRGFIRDVTDTSFIVERDQPVYGEENRAEIPFSALAEAKLVLTDELIRESLRADKAARDAANDEDTGTDPSQDEDLA